MQERRSFRVASERVQIVLKYPSLPQSHCSKALGQMGPLVICKFISFGFLKKSSCLSLADLKLR